MKNIFEEAYQKELQAIAAFDAAKNDEEKEKARELHNETFGQMMTYNKLRKFNSKR